jgi:hypothetical protein
MAAFGTDGVRADLTIAASVIASEAKQSNVTRDGLLRRYAPRNDGKADEYLRTHDKKKARLKRALEPRLFN